MKKNFKSFCFLTEPVTGNNNRQLLSGIDKIIRQLDQLKIDVQLDDPNIGNISTKINAIYTLLDDRLVKKLWITRADYDALAVKDPETLYIVIESQSNPSNP